MNEIKTEYYVSYLESKGRSVDEDSKKIARKVRSRLLKKAFRVYLAFLFAVLFLIFSTLSIINIHIQKKAIIAIIFMLLIIFLQNIVVNKIYTVFREKEYLKNIEKEFLDEYKY